MTRARGAKLTNDAVRELSFLKSSPDETGLSDLDFDISKAETAENGDVHIEGYINSSDVDDDLDEDVVDAKAFERDLKHFMRHPVIRREHKDPIGTVMKVEFRPEGPWFEGVVTHDAPNEKTRDMIQRKVLRGISARFSAKPKPEDVELLPKGKGRMRVKHARLVEVSVTDIPRNSGGHFKLKEPIRAAFQKSLGADTGVQPNLGGSSMEFMQLIARFLSDAGYQCKADDQVSIVKSLGDLIASGKNGQGLALIAKSLGKPESSTPQELIDALKAAENKEGTVAKSLFVDVEKKLADATVEITLFKHANRITPANKEFAKSLASSNPAMFEQWIPTQPEVAVAPLPGDNSGRTATPGFGTGTATPIKLSQLDFDLAKSYGAISDEKKLESLFNMKPHELVSQLLGQPVSETAHDKAFAQMHNAPWANVQ